PFGGQFLTSFGDESDLIGADLKCNCHNAGLDRQLEIKPHLDSFPEQAQIAVLNVPTVLAEMNRDAVSAAELGQDGSPDRVRFPPAPGLTKRGHMINVDAQSWHDRDPLRSKLKSHGRSGL